MSAQALAWLNAEFLQRVLKHSEGDESVEVQNFKKISAVEEGRNFASDIIRATVEYSRNKSGQKVIEKKSLIVKISPISEGLQKEMITEFKAFNTEIEMLDTTLAKMNNFLIEEEHRLNPNVLYTKIGDPSLIVMEDMAALGYRMVDGRTDLDLEHSILTMRSLAKFHAVSVALFEKEPKSMETYNRGAFHHENPEQFKKFITDRVRILGHEVLNWPELGSSARSYSEKLLKLSEVCFERAGDCCKPKDNEFNVLNHGDIWINNMLFRYNDEGQVTDHLFIDFQLCVWSSPAFDILKFLSTSISEDVDLHHRNALLEEYLKTLTKTMSRLQCTTKQPSMATLMKILMEHELFSVLWSIVGLRFLLVEQSHAKTFDELFQKDDGDVKPTYKDSGAFRKILLRRLPTWNARGLLDV